jgi:hypothetical protein
MGTNYRGYILDFLEGMRHPDGVSRPVDATTFGEIVAEIDKSEMDQRIIELFRHAHLNHHNPRDWYTLIGFFAEVLLDKKKPGVHPKWSRPKDTTLRRDFVQCLKRFPKRNGLRICETLKEELPRRYSAPAKTILRWVGYAGISITEIRRNAKKQLAAAKVRRNPARDFA